MRLHPLSNVEFLVSEPAGTTSIERCVTGFPVGFGGWTAAKMYERNMYNSNQQDVACETDNTAASAARQEVGLTYSNRRILMACSHGPRGRDKTVLSCLQLCSHRQLDTTRQSPIESPILFSPPTGDEAKLIETGSRLIKTRPRRNKTVLSAV